MKVYNPAAFRYRVEYAARNLVKGTTDSRQFDTCFEMNDGDAVTAAIVKRALKNPKLKTALRRHFDAATLTPEGIPKSMMQHYQRFHGQDLDQVAQALRNTQETLIQLLA
jgi:hypothetical protein